MELREGVLDEASLSEAQRDKLITDLSFEKDYISGVKSMNRENLTEDFCDWLDIRIYLATKRVELIENCLIKNTLI